MARALSLLTSRSRPRGEIRFASLSSMSATSLPQCSGATTIWSRYMVFGSTVTKPTNAPSASTSTMRATGTSSLRQRARHQATRSLKFRCG
jgi:hypothetical protein